MYRFVNSPRFDKDDGTQISGNNQEVAALEKESTTEKDTTETPEEWDDMDFEFLKNEDEEDESADTSGVAATKDFKKDTQNIKFAKMRRDKEAAEKKVADLEAQTSKDTSTEILLRAAKASGFNTKEEYLAAIEQTEKEVKDKQMKDAGITDPKVFADLIDSHPAIKEFKQLNQETKQLNRRAQIKEDKEDLEDKKFFDVLEPLIDDMVKNSKVSVKTAYNWLVGEKITELLAQEKGITKKEVLASEHDKQKRDVSLRKGDTSPKVPAKPSSAFERAIDKAFGFIK